MFHPSGGGSSIGDLDGLFVQFLRPRNQRRGFRSTTPDEDGKVKKIEKGLAPEMLRVRSLLRAKNGVSFSPRKSGHSEGSGALRP